MTCGRHVAYIMDCGVAYSMAYGMAYGRHGLPLTLLLNTLGLGVLCFELAHLLVDKSILAFFLKLLLVAHRIGCCCLLRLISVTKKTS